MKNPRFTNYIVFLCVFLFMLISCNSANVRFPILNDVQLSGLEICEYEITQGMNSATKEQYCANTFSSDKKNLFLCGNISGIKDVDAHIGIRLVKKGVEEIVSYNTIDDRFANGFFCRPVTLSDITNRKGIYVIKIYDGSMVINSIEFEIK